MKKQQTLFQPPSTTCIGCLTLFSITFVSNNRMVTPLSCILKAVLSLESFHFLRLTHLPLDTTDATYLDMAIRQCKTVQLEELSQAHKDSAAVDLTHCLTETKTLTSLTVSQMASFVKRRNLRLFTGINKNTSLQTLNLMISPLNTATVNRVLDTLDTGGPHPLKSLILTTAAPGNGGIVLPLHWNIFEAMANNESVIERVECSCLPSRNGNYPDDLNDFVTMAARDSALVSRFLMVNTTLIELKIHGWKISVEASNYWALV